MALAAGLVVVLVLSYADFVAANGDVVIGTVVLGPLLCSIWGRPRDVALVAALAVAAAVLSGAWNENFGEPTYYLRAGVVMVAALVALLAAARRAAVSRERSRFAVLSAVAEVGTGTRTLEETAERVTQLIVPLTADLCVIDVVAGAELRRLAVRADGPDHAVSESTLAAQGPRSFESSSPGGGPAATSVRLIEHVGRRGQDGARDERHAALMRSLGARSVCVVPLVARGRALGALTLATTVRTGRRYRASDAAFMEVLAGRIALALDNAGLFAELGTIEGQLSAALSGLAEAVTMQSKPGALVYANAAAARLMGFTSPHELLAAPVTELIERFAPRREDGTPCSPDEFPGRRVLAGQAAEPMVSRIIDGRTGDERWLLTKATPVYDRGGRVELVVNVIEDITEVKGAERDQRLLAAAGMLFSSSIECEDMLHRLAELVVPALADACSVSLVDQRGRLCTIAAAHRDRGKAAGANGNGERRAWRDTHGTAALEVPMLAAGRAIGVLELVATDPRHRFTAADRALAEELAARGATAVETARLSTERSRIAHTLQAGLLPDALPDIPGWELHSLYRPVEGDQNLVGGDFFDAIPVPGGCMALVGDVCGHGAGAAPLTALARHTLRATAKLLNDPLQAIARLNDELVERPATSLCTVGAALLREDAGQTRAELVCAGHPQALLVTDGEVRAVGCHGPLLGALPSPSWQRVSIDIPPGAILVLYTDGVLEATGPGRERFGDARLANAVARATSAQDAVARIDQALQSFQIGHQADDTAVLAIRRLTTTGADEHALAGRSHQAA